MQKEQWFESWFDSPWYPILYDHRDFAEAEAFILNLLSALQPIANSKFLDLACGRGRHSIFIHSHGYDVTGLDLSPASIADANLHAKEGLRFGVHDMREPFESKYDFIFNLFTSFGYFDNKEDNLRVLENVRTSLLPNGTFVMDFFNIHKVVAGMVKSETIEKSGIRFGIKRSFENGFVKKAIHIEDGDQIRDFEERVQGFDLEELQSMLESKGLKISNVWGDYSGAKYLPQESPRLIIFARKSA